MTDRDSSSTARKSGGDRSDARAREFFVPELCNVYTLSLLIVLGELVVVALWLAGHTLSLERFALMSFFVQWIVLLTAGSLCVARPYLARLPLLLGAVVSYCLVLFVTLVMSLLAAGVVGDRMVDIAQIAKNLVLSGITGGLILRYFYVQQQLRLQERSELQARIQALQSRIRPHFLFNSMNIIASLIPTEPETAETVVEDLSELFRASLNDAGNEVDLSEELALCERYLRIEGLRLDDRLNVDWDVEEMTEKVSIPLLTLQPLLENAIYHGIQPLPDGGTISIRLRRVAGQVQVRIVNPVPPASITDERQSPGNRMAMTNIRSRLEVLYGTQASLVGQLEDAHYITTLTYPIARSAG